MAQAAARFGEFLRSADIKAPSIPAYSNFTAGLYGDDVRTLLENQINHPVRWQKTVLDMARNGADTFICLLYTSAGASPPEADVQSTLRFIKFARGGFPARG